MSTTLDEHFGYLADTVRTGRFCQAIAATLAPGDTFADIGCGFGVLGLMCLKAGAERGWGIDSTEAIHIARETMQRAGLGERYICIEDDSFAANLPERVDLVICDHVGFFGVDYGIIALLSDARRRFLKPRGAVMPRRIGLGLGAIASPAARAKAEAWAAADMPAEFRWLRDYGVNTKHAVKLAPEDFATEPLALATIDLAGDNPDLLSYRATLVAVRNASLDGLAGWFECELAEQVWMTNSPFATDRIDRPQAFLPFERRVAVAAGDVIEVGVEIAHRLDVISWSVREPGGGKQKQSTWSSGILGPSDLRQKSRLPLERNAKGAARQVVLGYVDGTRSAAEIEQAVLRDHPDLLPTAEAISRFVQRELARSAR